MFVTSAFAQESAPSADTSHAATEGDTHSST
ncbi:ATP F0F1 synthase subunit B, partial [Mesorhizobium sp. M7A.T.Ca.TU.009.01.1.2]